MGTEKIFELMGTGEVCPGCDEEIAVSRTTGNQVELTCRCGCTLAAA